MSYKVIIVDDESKIIELIKMLGHWDKYGFEVVATTNDSSRALELIQEKNPDLVISDIKMPGIDGIELIEASRKSGSHALFILISGYRHFEYARSAISLNVMDYLLKPINEEQLNVTLEKVSLRLENIKESRESNMAYQSLKNMQASALQEEFWSYLTYPWKREYYNRYFLSEKICNEHFGFALSKEKYVIVIVSADVAGGLENPVSLFGNEVKRLIHKYLERKNILYYYMVHAGCNILINFDGIMEKEVIDGISALYFAIRDLQEIYGGFNLSVGVSETKNKCQELKEAFLEARAAEWGKLVMMQNGVLWHWQVSSLERISGDTIVSNNERNTILNCIKYLRPQELGDVFQDICKRVAAYSNIYPGCVSEAVYKIIDAADEIIVEEEREIIHTRCDMAVNEAKTYMNLFKNIFVVLEDYIQNQQNKLGQKSKKPILDAIAFINSSYAKPISQDDVAKSSNISSAYLSRIFKEEMGIGFQEYLTTVRVDKAEELLAGTNLSIKEIALSVGYPDEKYFSKLYKKITGIKPSEYRKIYG